MTDDGQVFLNWVADSVRKDHKSNDAAFELPPVSIPVTTAAPAEPPLPDEYKIVVFSGSSAREFRWRDGEIPAEAGQSTLPPSRPVANPVSPAAPPPANSAPAGVFTGESTRGDAPQGDWTQTTLKSDTDSADPSDDMTW